MGNVVDTLLSLLSPRNAEAKIVGDKESMQLIRDMYQKHQDNYLMSMYDKIVQAANNRPEEVAISQAPGLANIYGAAGDYANKQIHVDPSYQSEDKYGTIAHELVHFLNSVSDKPLSTDEQHSFIKTLLGSSTYVPFKDVQGYTPSPLTSEQSTTLESIIGTQR